MNEDNKALNKKAAVLFAAAETEASIKIVARPDDQIINGQPTLSLPEHFEKNTTESVEVKTAYSNDSCITARSVDRVISETKFLDTIANACGDTTSTALSENVAAQDSENDALGNPADSHANRETNGISVISTSDPTTSPNPPESKSVFAKLNSFASEFQKKHPSLWALKMPAALLVSIGFWHKLLIFWIAFIVAKPLIQWSYRRSSETTKQKVQESFPTFFRFKEKNAWLEVEEGADQCLPFVLFGVSLYGPFASLWFIGHWFKGFFNSPNNDVQSNTLTFSQNRRHDNSENNFYSSRAFGIVFLAFFASGIPAFISHQIYEKSGAEKILSQVKPVNSDIIAPPLPPPGKDAFNGILPNPTGAHHRRDALVEGVDGFWPWLRNFKVEPTKNSVFMVHFYLMSLAFALCALFFRTWFTFPLNFATDEHDVELTEYGIRRKNLKSWFYNVFTLNKWATAGEPDSMSWTEVKSLRRLEDGFTHLWPLPETAFKKESLTYKLLNKVAAFVDGISNKVNTGTYLVFSSKAGGDDFGRNIKINLHELNREQRARLYYSAKQWAPHAEVQKTAEEMLLGSRVFADNRYTKLWFDILTSRTQARRSNALVPGESLKDGAYTIADQISSGGQATAYLATDAIGNKVVLKEFILASNNSSSGALLESAKDFEAEVSLLSQISHPGIVKLEDFFAEDGRVYVVLEHLEGQSLRQKVMQSGPLSENEVAKITSALCDVLEYLHAQVPPIVHRDITPENILILRDGSIKVIDFSLAVKQDGLQATESCAKQCFTPPEQFRDEVSTQSDIYALGATMYFLLTGTVPKPISCSSPIKKAANISPEMNQIVEHATQLELSQRYESVKWLKIDLTSIN